MAPLVRLGLRIMTSHAAVLAALADPTRRVIVERIKAGPRSVDEIARGLPDQPAGCVAAPARAAREWPG